MRTTPITDKKNKMWIIPSTLPLYSAFAQECADSKEALSGYSAALEQSLMWKSKHLSFTTWLRKWNRVYWIPLLFGRTLKPSLQKTFTEKYTALLPDIRVSHSAMPEIGGGQMINDTFFHIYSKLLKQLNLFGASLKTFPDTSAWDMTKFTETFGIWVMRLRQKYSQRLKLALHTKEKGFSSLQWTTVTSQQQHTKYQQGGTPLMAQVNTWATPDTGKRGARALDLVDGNTATKRSSKQVRGIDLNTQVMKFPTPNSRDGKGGYQHGRIRKGKISMDTLDVAVQYFRPRPDSNSTIGKSREQLNPGWVAQLMGTTLEKTFFACTEMELLSKQPKKHSEL